MQMYNIIFLCWMVLTTAYGDRVEKDLIFDLLQNYSSLERPVPHHTDTLVIRIKFSLQQIIDIDERNQIITSNAWLDMQWQDYQLKWDKEENDNITKIRIPSKHIWTPDILLYNNADNNFDSTTQTSIVIDNHGNCLHMPPGLFKSTCKIDVSNFPFDEQVCTLKFGVWSYNGNQVDLQLQQGGGTDTTEYTESGEWKLIEVIGKRTTHKYKCCPEHFVDVTFSIVIRRRTMFYIINLVLPCVLNSVLTLLTFVLPAEAAEKITLAITVLLAQIVFMLLIMETMPPTSDAIPLISKYFACSLMTVCASVGGTVLVLSFYYKSPEIDGRMSPFLRKLLLVTIPRLMHMDPFAPDFECTFENSCATSGQKICNNCRTVASRKPDENHSQRLREVHERTLVLNNKQASRTYEGKENWRPQEGSTENTTTAILQKQGKGSRSKTVAIQLNQAVLSTLAGPHGRTIVNQRAKEYSSEGHVVSPSVSDDLQANQTRPRHQRRAANQSKPPYFDVSSSFESCNCASYSSDPAEASLGLRHRYGERNSGQESPLENSGDKAMREILRKMQRISRKLDQEKRCNEILLEWQYAARVLDKMFLWFFSLFVVVTTLATLFAVPNINHVFTL